MKCQDKGKGLHLAQNNRVKQHSLAQAGEETVLWGWTRGPAEAEPGVTSWILSILKVEHMCSLSSNKD